MKLLIITQVVDTEHPILGFFHRWIEEFANHCEHVHVIALQTGKHSLPENVTVHSLGKEVGNGKFAYVLRFYALIWKLRHEYDDVFVHMNQIYVILGAPLWHALRKRVGLWYVHGATSFSLRLAEKLVHQIFTSTRESFTVASSKVHYLGHGIDIAHFTPGEKAEKNQVFTIAHIGRISKIKNIDTLLESAKLLCQSGKKYRYLLYSEPVTESDKAYRKQLTQKVISYKLQDHFLFCGSVNNIDIPKILREVDMTVNLTPTGGMDKAVIESAAMGVPVVSSNQAFNDFFGKYQSILHVPHKDASALAQAISNLSTVSTTEYQAISNYLHEKAIVFDVSRLIPNVCAIMQGKKTLK